MKTKIEKINNWYEKRKNREIKISLSEYMEKKKHIHKRKLIKDDKNKS